MSHDLRHALRSLAKRPGYTLAILLILALGIGSITAIYSVTDAVVLRPLPYPQTERLMYFYETFRTDGSTSSVAYLDWEEWRSKNRTFEEIAASAFWMQLNMTGGEQPTRVRVNFVSPGYFKILAAQPALGRFFTTEEDRLPPGPPVAVVSHAFWQRQLEGRREAIGLPLTLNEQPVTVIGVMSPRFEDLSMHTEMWLPVTSVATLMNPSFIEARGNRWLHPVGRLKPGVTVEQARQDLEGIARSLSERFPENKDIGMRFEPVSNMIFNFLDLRTSTLALLAAAALLLLICCINVANLLILRITERARESALRLALGSGNVRLMMPLVLENLILSVVGGLLGLLLGYWGIQALLAFGPLELPRFATISMNGRVVVAMLVVSIATGLVLSFLPLLRSRKVALRDTLAGGGRGSSSGTGFARKALIVAEVALALVLLTIAGLMAKSVYLLIRDDVGVDMKRLAILRVSLEHSQYVPPPLRDQFARRLLERIQAIPGVEQAGIWAPGIPGVSADYGSDMLPDLPPGSAQRDPVYVRRHHISPGAIRDLGITLLKGREFGDRDVIGQPRVALVSETLARETWPDQDPIGKRLQSVASQNWYEIVGMVADVRHGGRTWEAIEPFRRDIYLPFFQAPEFSVTLFVRTQGEDFQGIGNSLRQAVAGLDPTVPTYQLSTLAEMRRGEEGQYRFRAFLVTLFGILALVLTGIGIYSVLAYAVSQRTREIGIRSALGADRGGIVRLILKQGAALVAIGLGLGLVLAFAVRKSLASLLYGVSPNDPWTLAAILVVLALLCLGAITIPARRAARVDPVVALRVD